MENKTDFEARQEIIAASRAKLDAAPVVRFRWTTGYIEIGAPDFFSKCSAAKFKQLLTLAEIEPEETARAASEIIQALHDLAEATENAAAMKRAAALLAVLDKAPKQSRIGKQLAKIAQLCPDRYRGYITDGERRAVCQGAFMIETAAAAEISAAPQGEAPALFAQMDKAAQSCTAAVKLPTAKEIKTVSAIHRQRRGDSARLLWQLAPGATYDPALLLHVLSVFPQGAAYIDPDASVPVLFVRAADGQAILMPLKRRTDADATQYDYTSAPAPEIAPAEEAQTKPAPEIAPPVSAEPAAPEKAAAPYTVAENADFGSVEIAFASRPPYAVREALKARRFRWHSVRRIWYGYRTTAAEAAALLQSLYTRAPLTSAV